MCLLLKQVTCMYGPAQLEYKNSCGKKCVNYTVDSQSQHGGCGHGCHRGWGCGRGSHGGCRGCHGNMCGSDMINGIDISDLTHSFATQEWDSLGHGCAIVMQLHEHAQGHRHGHDSHSGPQSWQWMRK